MLLLTFLTEMTGTSCFSGCAWWELNQLWSYCVEALAQLPVFHQLDFHRLYRRTHLDGLLD
jgi:hypothetical protein